MQYIKQIAFEKTIHICLLQPDIPILPASCLFLIHPFIKQTCLKWLMVLNRDGFIKCFPGYHIVEKASPCEADACRLYSKTKIARDFNFTYNVVKHTEQYVLIYKDLLPFFYWNMTDVFRRKSCLFDFWLLHLYNYFVSLDLYKAYHSYGKRRCEDRWHMCYNEKQ